MKMRLLAEVRVAPMRPHTQCHCQRSDVTDAPAVTHGDFPYSHESHMGSDRQLVDTSRSSPAAVSQELDTWGRRLPSRSASDAELQPNRSLGTSK